MLKLRNSLWIAALSTTALAQAVAPAADAAIVTYGFTGTTSTDDIRHRKAAVAAGANVTASDITNGAGMVSIDTIFREVPANSDDFGMFQKATGFGADPGANTEAEAVAEDVYWSFTVTPTAGSITLAELTFDTLYFNSNANATLFVRSSVDNYATNLGESFATTTVTRTPRSIALSPDFQNLSGPLTFRFYMYAPEGLSSGLTGGVDNIQLHVPEPGTMGLLGLGGLMLLRRRGRTA